MKKINYKNIKVGQYFLIKPNKDNDTFEGMEILYRRTGENKSSYWVVKAKKGQELNKQHSENSSYPWNHDCWDSFILTDAELQDYFIKITLNEL